MPFAVVDLFSSGVVLSWALSSLFLGLGEIWLLRLKHRILLSHSFRPSPHHFPLSGRERGNLVQAGGGKCGIYSRGENTRVCPSVVSFVPEYLETPKLLAVIVRQVGTFSRRGRFRLFRVVPRIASGCFCHMFHLESSECRGVVSLSLFFLFSLPTVHVPKVGSSCPTINAHASIGGKSCGPA